MLLPLINLEDHGVNPQYLCWTQRRLNVCTMNIFKDILDQRESTFRERSCPDTQILKSGTTSLIAPLTCALSRFVFFSSTPDETSNQPLFQVPSLFQDNFDYLDIRRDFVHGILTSDILMKNIYCYVAEEGYAARVQDTRSYESIRYGF